MPSRAFFFLLLVGCLPTVFSASPHHHSRQRQRPSDSSEESSEGQRGHQGVRGQDGGRFLSSAIGLFTDAADAVANTAVSGARLAVHNPVTNVARGVASGAVEGAKEIAVIATDPKPIFPGTRWCGAGSRAKNDSDVGPFEGADSCCRDHDNCPDNINAGKSKHGLNNTGTFTRSHCDCDEQFFKCLKADDSLPAKKIGYTYFNVLKPQCFKNEKPIKRCAESSGVALTRRCNSYELDEQSTERKWQWFDAREF